MSDQLSKKAQKVFDIIGDDFDYVDEVNDKQYFQGGVEYNQEASRSWSEIKQEARHRSASETFHALAEKISSAFKKGELVAAKLDSAADVVANLTPTTVDPNGDGQKHTFNEEVANIWFDGLLSGARNKEYITNALTGLLKPIVDHQQKAIAQEEKKGNGRLTNSETAEAKHRALTNLGFSENHINFYHYLLNRRAELKQEIKQKQVSR